MPQEGGKRRRKCGCWFGALSAEGAPRAASGGAAHAAGASVVVVGGRADGSETAGAPRVADVAALFLHLAALGRADSIVAPIVGSACAAFMF